MFAQVIVDIAHSQVDKIFEYSCPDNLQVGSRVKVPFGGKFINGRFAGEKVVDGFVIGVSEKSAFPPEKIKPIKEVFDEAPALVTECFSLMERISSRYRVPKAAALRLFLPSEMRLGKVREAFKKYAKVRDISAAIPKNAKKQREVMDFLQTVDEYDYTALCNKFGAGAVNALAEKGAVEIEKRQIQRKPFGGEIAEESAKTLTYAQVNAIDSIENSEKTVHLIHGVTGSGKTEIYLQLIAREIARGRTAIFLVPEISLTPQMLSQLRARFKGEAAILHSGLSAGEKFDEWWRLRSGEAKIAIGARSAIFAPLENLGVIIIDEEHDSSYVSETAPRYSTQEIAQLRAEYYGCKLVLGSATPSVESYGNAAEGRFNLITFAGNYNFGYAQGG